METTLCTTTWVSLRDTVLEATSPEGGHTERVYRESSQPVASACAVRDQEGPPLSGGSGHGRRGAEGSVWGGTGRYSSGCWLHGCV